MAERPVICEEFPTETPLLPAVTTEQRILEAPAHHAGSFFVRQSLLDTLRAPADPTLAVRFTPHAAYDNYLQLDKTLVDVATIPKLLKTHRMLKSQLAPLYLNAAGWASAEAGLMDTVSDEARRLQRIDWATDCWEAGIRLQKAINTRAGGSYAEHTRPLRMGLAIATMPLLKGMISGNLTVGTCKNVFEVCLDIAKYNQELQTKAEANGDEYASIEHAGFGHEMIGMLAINRRFSSTRFAIPSTARADSGQYLPRQTHDLIAIHQHWGELRSALPIEIKGFGSKGDHKRYKALLIRSKIHLSGDQLTPDDTLQAIDAVYTHQATDAQRKVADEVSDRVFDMMHDYCAGAELASFALRRTTRFRDNARVVKNHPGMVLNTFIREHAAQAG